MLTGWKCTECGKVNAPWVPECPGHHTVPIRLIFEQVVPPEPTTADPLIYPLPSTTCGYL